MMYHKGDVLKLCRPHRGFSIGETITIVEGHHDACISVYRGYTSDGRTDWFGEGSLRPLTNGEYVRSLSDEELRYWYCQGRSCHVCDYHGSYECQFKEWWDSPVQSHQTYIERCQTSNLSCTYCTLGPCQYRRRIAEPPRANF